MRFLGCLPLFLALGCGNTSVSGTVTYDGTPIEDGQISFLPVDGQGTPAGGPIVNGKYKVEKGLAAGKRKVEIIGNRRIAIDPNGPEAERYGSIKFKVVGDLVPDNAMGNNTIVDIVSGTGTWDFSLLPPAKKKS